MVEFNHNKAKANLRKHGIHMSECESVIRDPASVTVEDWSEGAHRFNTLGVDHVGRVLVVTWTERRDDIRIISARRASAAERKNYHGTRT